MKRRRKLIGFNLHIMNGAFIRYIFKMSVYCAIAGMTRCSPQPAALTCLTAPGLARAQRAVCARAPLAAAAALAGAREAARECRHQFRWHRWNCSGLLGKGGEPHTSAIMKRGYRETAFAHALESAGAARAVARACAAGALLECACGGARPAARWKWGGCSHNLDFGVAFARRFLDAGESGGDVQSRVNLHNNRAGRLALAANMEVRCKCHGMSGSCQLKTCWRAAPSMRVIGTILREKFRSAMIADQAGLNRGNPALRGRRRGKRRGRTRRAPAPSLLYYETSPSFCERDASNGIPGTSGRACRRNASAPGGCDSLCCGRGHDLVRRRKTKSCKCKFEWCCTVSCETCTEEKWISVCK